MPDFYPEGDSPLTRDSQEKSLHKAVSLLGKILEAELEGSSSPADSITLRSGNGTLWVVTVNNVGQLDVREQT